MHNPYARSYMMMGDIFKTQRNHMEIRMWITKDRAPDPRRYNLPVATEIAAVFDSEDGEPPINRDICVRFKGNGMTQNIPFYSPNCDPMIYPILFPHGDFGWRSGIPRVGRTTVDADENENEESRRNVSMLDFFSHRLQTREVFNPLLRAGTAIDHSIIYNGYKRFTLLFLPFR